MSFDREPIFWTTTQPGYNTVDRERSAVHPVTGRRITERIPQRGHQGDYENRRPAQGIRSIEIVRHEGHIVHLCLTNAAAHLDSSTPFGNYQRAKMRHFGWFPVGACPLALVMIGELVPDQIVNKAMLDEKPCPPASLTGEKCPHCRAEIAARTQMHAQLEAEKAISYRDPTERMIEAGREQTVEMVTKIMQAMRDEQHAREHVEALPRPRATKKKDEADE